MIRRYRTPLQYSEDFKNAVLKAFPNNTSVKQMLDNNDGYLQRFLDDTISTVIHVDTVITMIEKDEIDNLYFLALGLKEKQKLIKMIDKEIFLDPPVIGEEW